MARIQEAVMDEGFNLMVKFLDSGATFIWQISQSGVALLREGNNFTRTLLEAWAKKLEQHKLPTDIVGQMLDRERNGETIITMGIPEENLNEICAKFNDKGILYNVIQSTKDDSYSVLYMSNDKEKVRDAIATWKAERGLETELEPSAFLDNFAPNGIDTLTGLDREELVLFRRIAREQKIVHTAVPMDKESYLIALDPKDHEAAQRALAMTIWATSGARGKRLRKRIQRYLDNRNLLYKAFEQPEKEQYIVDAKNPENYIHFTANDFSYFKNGELLYTVNRNDPNYLDMGTRVLKGMKMAVVLEREEYEQFLEDGKQDKVAVEKVITEKTRDLAEERELWTEQEKQNERLALIQQKMALDDENTAGFWIFDGGISFAEGGSFEGREDIDEQTKDDMTDARNRAKKYKFHEVKAEDNRSVDFLIREAEKQRKAPQQEPAEPTKER